jgi:hypothetical protein
MRILRLLAPVLLLALAGCVAPSSAPPGPQPDIVTRSSEQNGKFSAFVGPRRQQAEPFLGVPGTNFYALRSWIDTRNGETLHQLYVEDSYFGAERNWQAARDGAGQKLKFVAISKNEITCENGCSYAEEFGAELPEALLRASGKGLTVVFTAKLGLEKTVAVPGDLIEKQLAAVAAARAPAPTAAATPSPAR